MTKVFNITGSCVPGKHYMASKMETSGKAQFDHLVSSYIEPDGTLNIEKILLKFQEFMKEQYSKKDKDFLERN